MILCEQCGNTFLKGKLIETPDGRYKLECPYCRWKNNMPRRKRKRKEESGKQKD